MIAWKLFRQLNDGTLKSLFANRARSLPVNRWLRARYHPVKVLKPQRGWHCVTKPYAPHLSLKGRVWRQVEIDEYETIKRPECQGGTWLIAQKMRILKSDKNKEENIYSHS